MSDIFEAITHGRETAKAKEAAGKDSLPLETITTYAFEMDLDNVAKESNEQLAEHLELESRKAEILGVVNHTFVMEAFNHIEQTVGNNFSFDNKADQLTPNEWLTHYQNTVFLPYAHWIVGEQPRMLKNKLVHDYLVRTKADSPSKRLKIITTKKPIKPTDPFPSRQSTERFYNPKTGTFTATDYIPQDDSRDPGFLPHSYSTGESIHTISDDQMKSFQVATYLMDLLHEYGALDNSDPLVASYKNAREWSVTLPSVNIQLQRGLVANRLENKELNAYAKALQAYLNLEPKDRSEKRTIDDFLWGN